VEIFPFERTLPATEFDTLHFDMESVKFAAVHAVGFYRLATMDCILRAETDPYVVIDVEDGVIKRDVFQELNLNAMYTSCAYVSTSG
jgi:hypothetical protein